MVPTEEVLGVGAVADPVPPVAVVYHNSVLPDDAVAVKGAAASFKQYATEEVTAGAGGRELIVRVLEFEPGPHWSLLLTVRVIVWDPDEL